MPSGAKSEIGRELSASSSEGCVGVGVRVSADGCSVSRDVCSSFLLVSVTHDNRVPVIMQ